MAPKKAVRLDVRLPQRVDELLRKLEAKHVAERPEIVRRAIVEMAHRDLPQTATPEKKTR